MKVYRYPQTDPTKCELTDEKSFSVKKDMVGFENGTSIDITIDKTGLRQSMAYLEFEEKDLENLHARYVDYLKLKNESLELRIRELEKKVIIHRHQWYVINEILENDSTGKLLSSPENEYPTPLDGLKVIASDMWCEDEFNEFALTEEYVALHQKLKSPEIEEDYNWNDFASPFTKPNILSPNT